MILTRRDPDLALNKMRMVGSVQELRRDDLRFTSEEIQSFLSSAIGEGLSDELIAMAEEQMDGWAVAMQMMVVSLRNQQGRQGQLGGATAKLPSLPTQVSKQLIEEIFTDVPPESQAIVISMALFDHFCQGLTSAVMPDEHVEEFYAWLVSTNLFVIYPDQEDGWFRLHSFFQEALLNRSKVELAEDEVQLIHQRATEWFDAQGMVQEAIAQALLSGDGTLAGEVVAHHLQHPDWQGDYFLRGLWLDALPVEVINQSSILLVEATWRNYRANLDWSASLKRAEKAAKKESMSEDATDWVKANLASLYCASYYTQREFKASIKAGKQALDNLSSTHTHLRALTLGLLSLSYRGSGDDAAALQAIHEGRELCQHDPAALSLILIADSYSALMYMNMSGLLASALHCLQHCEKFQLLAMADLARVFAGFACYQMNDLAQAERHLTRTDLDLARMNYRYVVWGQSYLAQTYAAQERWADADDLLVSLLNSVKSRPNPLFLGIVEGLQAQFELRRGRISKVSLWLQHRDAPSCEPKDVNLTPVVGYVRGLLSQDTQKSRDQAKSMIDAMMTSAEAAKLMETQVQCHILKSLWNAHQGQQTDCQASIGDAVRMAQHGGALRVFADFGVELIPSLQKLKLNTEGIEYIGRVVKAIKIPRSDKESVDAHKIQSTIHMPLMESLSKREFEVLQLLAKHCSNNDISDQLFISLGTVKRHVSNIYQKLAVHGRKEAVAKAVGLGLIK